ncbi:MAG: hypothetical protein IJI51_09770 [Lachnospiraceae bacterium]|nr:hypothetical protein [Lachnospiraceae bacterium]
MYTDHILIFIDYLLIPFLALSIDIKRSGKEAALSLANFLRYVSYTVAVFIVTYIIRVVIARLGFGVTTDAGTGIYTILATLIALVAPYVRELVATYCNVRCEIKKKD